MLLFLLLLRKILHLIYLILFAILSSEYDKEFIEKIKTSIF